MRQPKRGEVWWCEHPDIGRRPVVLLSRDAAIAARGYAIVAPCTTTVRCLPSEVPLRAGQDPVPRDCVVNLDSLEQISIALLMQRVGQLSTERIRAVCAALAVAVDC
jgi:mRNA interferase MazF